MENSKVNIHVDVGAQSSLKGLYACLYIFLANGNVSVTSWEHLSKILKASCPFSKIVFCTFKDIFVTADTDWSVMYHDPNDLRSQIRFWILPPPHPPHPPPQKKNAKIY